jgi:hypothetical protein
MENFKNYDENNIKKIYNNLKNFIKSIKIKKENNKIKLLVFKH